MPINNVVECRLYAGVCNNIFQILAAIQTAILNKTTYYIIIPTEHHKDHNRSVLGGHNALYGSRHRREGLPYPTDLPENISKPSVEK